MTRELRTPHFSPEVRERAVRMVVEHAQEHASQWAAITSIAAKIGCTAETLRRWVNQAERDQGRKPGTTTDDRERLKALERENCELRQANEILRKASGRYLLANVRVVGSNPIARSNLLNNLSRFRSSGQSTIPLKVMMRNDPEPLRVMLPLTSAPGLRPRLR